jgi:single-strand DNA-binding protein
MLNMTAVGRIGRDAELRKTPNGDSVCNVAIGCNYGRKGNDGKQPTQWVEGALWGDRAEKLAEYLTKGKQVILVLQDVHIETYQGQNGDGHKLVGRIADLAFGAEPRNQDDGAGQQRSQGNGYGGNQQRTQAPRQQPQRQQPQRQASTGFDDMDDDIPF